MKRQIIFIVGALFAIFITPCIADEANSISNNATSVHECHDVVLSNAEFQAIQIATEVLHKYRPTWSHYQISVVETDISLSIMFWQPESSDTVKYALPQKNGPPLIVGEEKRVHDALVVELAKKTFRLLDVHSVR